MVSGPYPVEAAKERRLTAGLFGMDVEGAGNVRLLRSSGVRPRTGTLHDSARPSAG
jgi:hypothetical protein